MKKFLQRTKPNKKKKFLKITNEKKQHTKATPQISTTDTKKYTKDSN